MDAQEITAEIIEVYCIQTLEQARSGRPVSYEFAVGVRSTMSDEERQTIVDLAVLYGLIGHG